MACVGNLITSHRFTLTRSLTRLILGLHPASESRGGGGGGGGGILWNMIIDSNAGVTEPPLKFRHVWVITPHTNQCYIITYPCSGKMISKEAWMHSRSTPIYTAPLYRRSIRVIMGAIAPQITSFTIVYSTVYPDADQIKHQSSASLAFVRGIHRGPLNSPHKGPVTRKMFSFDDVIMLFL